MVTGAPGISGAKLPRRVAAAAASPQRKRCPLETTGGLLGVMFAGVVLVLLLIVVQYICAEADVYKRRIRLTRDGGGDGGLGGDVDGGGRHGRHGGGTDAQHYDAHYGQEASTLPTGGASLWGMATRRATLQPIAVSAD